MPLILAIEPDRHQAGQLSAIARGQLHAELVIEATAERAFAELGDRVPDLILTAALLSPKDEAALAERLRALESVAAHVHTLTIPVLAAPRSRARIGGMLSALRRDKTQAAEPDGCDPAVFAEQCATYLERAVSERRELLSAGDLDADAQAQQTVHDVVQAPAEDAPTSAVVGERHDVYQLGPGIDTPVVEDPFEARLAAEASATDIVDEQYVGFDEAMVAAEEPEGPVESFQPRAVQDPPSVESLDPGVATAALEMSIGEEPAAPVPPTSDGDSNAGSDGPDPLGSLAAAVRAAEADSAGVDTPAAGSWNSSGLHAVDLPRPWPNESDSAAPASEEIIDRTPAVAAAPVNDAGEMMFDESPLFELVNEAPAESRGVDGDDELDRYIELDLSEFLDQSTPILHTVRAGGEAPPDAVAPAPPRPAPAAPVPIAASEANEQLKTGKPEPAGEPDEGDWLDVVEALRRDVERLDAAPAAGPRSSRPPRKLPPARKPRKGKPVQDEWGFFDPEQCGFAALLAKLDEVTAKNGPRGGRKPA